MQLYSLLSGLLRFLVLDTGKEFQAKTFNLFFIYFRLLKRTKFADDWILTNRSLVSEAAALPTMPQQLTRQAL